MFYLTYLLSVRKNHINSSICKVQLHLKLKQYCYINFIVDTMLRIYLYIYILRIIVLTFVLNLHINTNKLFENKCRIRSTKKLTGAFHKQNLFMFM